MIDLLKNSPPPRLYMANPGNLGDALIREGTLHFFRSIGLEHQEVRNPPEHKVGTFVFGGGGAWCRNWDHSYFVSAALQKADTIIVLPSTYAIDSPLYDSQKIHFFCRDTKQSQILCPRARFHQDMAFHLARSITPRLGTGVGYFMRTDKERLGAFDVPRGNKDISTSGQTFNSTKYFIDAIGAVKTVHTDRLHVAIAACMLGKKIYFYAGNYFKNRAVYLSSMKDRFDVTFREHDRGQPADR
jgi:hypothetical protein